MNAAFHLLGSSLDLLLRAVQNFACFLLNLASNFFHGALDLIGAVDQLSAGLADIGIQCGGEIAGRSVR